MSIFSLFKRDKCFGCESSLNEEYAVLRVQSEGELVEIKICDKCADIWDKSAEILQKRGNDDAESV
jgi:formate dehydrogenase maturation protein FdhE